jgi:Domain of unknown function (DUF4173)
VSRPKGPLEAKPAAPAALLAGATWTGVLAGALLVDLAPGINWLLVGAVVAAVVAWSFGGKPTKHCAGFGAASLALLATAALTSSEWVLVLALLAALALASFAAAPGRTWGEVVLGVTGAGWRLPEALSWLLRARKHVPGGRSVGRTAPLLRGVMLGAFLLVVFGTLFATADRAFAQVANRVVSLPDLEFHSLARVIVGALAALFTGALASFAPAQRVGMGGPVDWIAAANRVYGPKRAPHRLGRTEWVTALLMLDALFAVFVVVQIAVLFGGRAHVLETSGLTYAEYARSGFFQLLAVAALTLAVLGGVVHFGRCETRRYELVLRVLSGVLIALTMVVLASALRRLTLYEEVYGFTRLRLTVHVAIAWFAGIFALVAFAGATSRVRWVPRALVAFTAVVMLVFALLRPDAFIASRNVDRFERTGKIDVSYLRSLSADAVPALATLPEPQRSCSLVHIRTSLQDEEPLWALNAARTTGRRILAATPEGATALETCPIARGTTQ